MTKVKIFELRIRFGVGMIFNGVYKQPVNLFPASYTPLPHTDISILGILEHASQQISSLDQ